MRIGSRVRYEPKVGKMCVEEGEEGLGKRNNKGRGEELTKINEGVVRHSIREE